MIDLILELIDFNEGVNYAVVTKIIVVYLALLWFFVSVWVFNDAKYRFNSWVIAFFLAILNLILSFPFLLIYLLVRPSHREDLDDFSEEGGVNIPIVNFTKDNGVVISLQLKIDSKKIVEDNIDYKLDVALTKDDETVIPGRVEISGALAEAKVESSSDESEGILSRATGFMKNIGSTLKSKLSALKAAVQNKLKKTEDIEEEENFEEDLETQRGTTTEKDEYRPRKKKNKPKKKKRK